MKKITFIIIGIFIMCLLAWPTHSLAQSSSPQPSPPSFYQPKTDETLLPTPTGQYAPKIELSTVTNQIAVKVLNTVSNIFLGLSVLFLIISGFQFAFARGNDDAINKAVKSGVYAGVGIIVILLAYTIIFIINTIFS